MDINELLDTSESTFDEYEHVGNLYRNNGEYYIATDGGFTEISDSEINDYI